MSAKTIDGRAFARAVRANVAEQVTEELTMAAISPILEVDGFHSSKVGLLGAGQ